MTTQRTDLDGAVDAVAFTREGLGKSLRAAREHAHLSVERLARKLDRSTSAVEDAERGLAQVRPSYVDAVLAACGENGIDIGARVDA